MAISKAQQRATNKYKKANYDRMELVVPKGKKATIQEAATAVGESVNAYINGAVDQRLDCDKAVQDAPESPPEAAGAPTEGGGTLVSPKMLEAAQDAAERTGEAVADFIRRAVETQVKRDKSAIALGINPATGEKLKREV